jgi:hypothetical protein
MKKDKLLNLVADLVEMLIDNGANKDIIVHTLKYYGLTESEIADWYGLEISEFETYNEAPYGEKNEK